MESEITVRRAFTPALRNAVERWAQARTDPESPRRADLLRDKIRTMREFFTFTGKHAGQVTPLDVATWSAHLEDRNLGTATISVGRPVPGLWSRTACSRRGELPCAAVDDTR